MKRQILPAVCMLVCSLTAGAQNNPDRAFAIVSSDPGAAQWMNIQEVDLSTGKVIRKVFEKDKTPFILMDAITRKQLATQPTGAANTQTEEALQPTATMVAGAAFDRRHNRLYFTPMRVPELRWIDFSSGGAATKVYCLTGQRFSFSDLEKEENHITRMAIAADGNGYALSNDANIFTRFSTGKKPVIEQLGQIKDDPQNGDISIHDRLHWGGDMIADASDNLYVIGANHSVFRIGTRSRVATFLGYIQGLPEAFSTNGAAIDRNGDLILSSAQSPEGFYKADLLTIQAFRPDMQYDIATSADLATGYLAFEQTKETANVRLSPSGLAGKDLSIYPNPVRRGYLTIDLNGYAPGQYECSLLDLNGRVVSSKKLVVNGRGQTERISVNRSLVRGTYLITISNGFKKKISLGKIILE